MKKALAITLLYLAMAPTYGQMAHGNRPDCEVEGARSSCAKFMCHYQTRQHEAAYGMMVRGELKNCSGADLTFAQVQVLASNRKVEAAIEALERFFDDYPNDPRYAEELRRLLKQEELQKNALPIEFISPDGLTALTHSLPAWMVGQVPVTVHLDQDFASHFPYTRLNQEGYALNWGPSDSIAGFEHLVRTLALQEYAHIGPGQLVADSVLYYTAVTSYPYGMHKDADKLKIFELDVSAKRAKPHQMPFCQKGAHDAFPAFDPVTGILIFSSDRPGGRGGMDLWKTQWTDAGWTEPIPLSEKVNTPAEEIYAELSGDTLFFASNRTDMGLGGMDVYGYSLSGDSIWNLGYPLNTAHDDFRMTLSSTREAYFASNRPAAEKGDHIYKVKWTAKELFFKKLVGHVNWGDKAIGKKVTLINTETGARQTAVIDTQGNFHFDHIRGKAAFEIVVDDLDVAEGDVLTLSDGEGNLLHEVAADAKGGFAFVMLSPIDYTLNKMHVEDGGMLSVDILGMLDGPTDDTQEGLRIVLLDSDGHEIGTTQTDRDGGFKFNAVRPDMAYTIHTEGLSKDAAIHILGRNGEVIQSIMPDENQDFVYVRLKEDDRVITLTNELGQQVHVSTADVFEMGSVYYHYNDYEVSEASAASLDRVARILSENPHIGIVLEGHTDARGGDAYNMALSQLRIDAAMDYLADQGIPPKQMTGRGYGEQRLKNRCADGVECTEEEHAANRRTEFRFVSVEEM